MQNAPIPDLTLPSVHTFHDHFEQNLYILICTVNKLVISRNAKTEDLLTRSYFKGLKTFRARFDLVVCDEMASGKKSQKKPRTRRQRKVMRFIFTFLRIPIAFSRPDPIAPCVVISPSYQPITESDSVGINTPS